MKHTRISIHSSLPRTRARALVAGWTLIESLIVLAVIAVVLRLSFPSMEAILTFVRLSSASDDFVAHLYLAKSEALKRNSRVAMCKTGGGSTCTGSGGWEGGWIVFHDENNNGIADAGDEVIARHEGLPLNLKLSGNQPVAKYISFTSTGASKLTGGGFQAGTLTVCRYSEEGGDARQIILNAVGRPRVQKVTVNACV